MTILEVDGPVSGSAQFALPAPILLGPFLMNPAMEYHWLEHFLSLLASSASLKRSHFSTFPVAQGPRNLIERLV